MKAYYEQNGKTVSINIEDVEIADKNKEEFIIAKFNKNTQALEWVGGTTYCVTYKSLRLKSSSLDELLVMYKSAWMGLPVPERKCFMLAKK